MKVEWQGSVDVSPAPEQVFAYLSDFQRHGEWATSLVSVTQIVPGNGDGIGARYEAVERSGGDAPSGWRGRIPRRQFGHSVCEVTEVVPGKSIGWVANPQPKVGEARIRFEFVPRIDGGTRIFQSIEEFYPLPAELVLRFVFGVREPEMVQTFGANLETLRATVEERVGAVTEKEVGNRK